MSDGDAVRNVVSIRPRKQLAELVEKASATIHDINNPLTFLVANLSVEEEHVAVFHDLLSALGSLNDPLVTQILQGCGANGRLRELQEIMVDNKRGLERIRGLVVELRGTLKE